MSADRKQAVAPALEDEPARYAEVAVDFTSRPQALFTYLIAKSEAQPGDLVRVPFGAMERYGVVVRLSFSTDLDPDKVRPVHERIRGGPFISPNLLSIAEWISTRYHVPMYAVCSGMLPPGVAMKLKTWVWRNIELDSEQFTKLSSSDRHSLELAPAKDTPVLDKTFAKKLGDRGRDRVAYLVRRKLLASFSELPAPRLKRRTSKRVFLLASSEEALKKLDKAETSANITTKTKDLVRHITRHEPEHYSLSALKSKFGAATLQNALTIGVAEERVVELTRDPLTGYTPQVTFPPDLRSDQATSVDAVIKAMRDGGGRFLLFGVTGSGKTEVYLRCVERCLSMGRKAIVLVPELSLTAQMLLRFSSRFPGKVGLLHSGLTERERFDEWERIRRGERSIVLGARSAVFAPVSNLGLVVIDEEHEWAYEQREYPFYSAREVATRLCQQTGAAMILGSATPEMSSFHKTIRGEIQLLRLTRRPFDINLPTVTVTDMKNELREGHYHMLSRALLKMMHEDLEAGGSVLLFLNRRGVASFIQCITCGTVRFCPRCSVSLTHHRPSRSQGNGRLMCHYCGYRTAASGLCPECGGKAVSRNLGDQALEEVVKKEFPYFPTIRWDSDTTPSYKKHQAIFEAIHSGRVRIIIGTQMVAKGHDFSGITLAAAVAADTGLAFPDYRASERTFQLLTQVTGRAGRGAWAGRAVIQTFQPDHYAIKAAGLQDYELFYNLEIARRARYNLPPFVRVVRLVHEGRKQDNVINRIREHAERLRNVRITEGHTEVEIKGPSPCWPERVGSRYRWQLVLTSPDPMPLLDTVPLEGDWRVIPDLSSL